MESKSKVYILLKNTKGDLTNAYSPLQNLVSESTGLIGDMSTKKLQFDRDTPVELSITDEYDGSTNIILNDDKHNPKLINTRFSIQENKTYNIPIHMGNQVTNIYDESTFGEDSQLLKLYKNIPDLEFQGLINGGSFKCGSYVFYFKLADADNNLTNTVLESGIILVHMGQVGTNKIRMGMQDENAEKCIKFKLSNIDSGFDYVRIFYERMSSDESQAMIGTYFMIDQNFPIIDNTCEILLTGSEPTISCTNSDLNNEFADIQTAKTQAIVDTTLFLGNITAYELNYQELLSIAWSIVPEIIEGKDIGSIACNRYQTAGANLYYDQQNAYYYTGYWSDELYRFGVVFIYNNNLLSPVFNILGCDFDKLYNDKTLNKEDTIYSNLFFDSNSNRHKTEPEDYFFNKKYLFNSKGVIKLPKKQMYKTSNYSNMVTPNILGIKFHLEHIVTNLDKVNDIIPSAKELLQKNNIKGLFFVRQKRIPTIIAQGMVIGLTGKDHGSIPVLKKEDNYVTKSFLDLNRLLTSGHTIEITSEVFNKALLVPDYEMDTATLNLFFTGTDFYLDRIAQTSYGWYGDSSVINYIDTSKTDKLSGISKLTAVLKETKITTDGENYFSSMAGIMDEAYKTADVNLVWDKTVPQDLTVSNSLIRGKWGSYVGMSSNKFEYGDLVNIKIKECGNKDWEELEFYKRFLDFSFYSAISPRKSLESIFDRSDGGALTCYRGDCYFNVFTHRMMSNFIDGELPTNTKIVDPGCWATNYGVRCTAQILNQTHSNLTSDADGWYIPYNNTKSNIVSIIFGILTLNVGAIIQASRNIANLGTNLLQQTFANEIVQAFEVAVDVDPATSMVDILSGGKIKKVNPKEQEASGKAFNLKAIFKCDDGWELHGLASINRADVNAVSFGLWMTFPVCSNYNLALRDIDFTHATEEASLNRKRAFYPLEEMNVYNHLLESEVINGAAKRTISSNGYPAFTTVPYIKQEYFNRIYWSKPNVAQQFINSYRMIFRDQFLEYNKEFGAITKIIPMLGSILVVFQHGIGVLPVNRTPQTDQERSPYLSSKSVLPTQVLTISRDYGSMWKDSVIQTPSGIVYGVDTVAKKIWRTDGQKLEFISDHKISKFLNDWIDLSEYDFTEYVGHINVKTHYNEFKHDVMFTYYKDTKVNDTWEKGTTWNLCYNEVLQKWITFYDWYPVHSCNIDNIFFSFDKEKLDGVYDPDTYIKDFSLPLDLLSRRKGFTSFSYNKVLMDKMFASTTTVYKNTSNKTIKIQAIKGENRYFSFYAKNIDKDFTLLTDTDEFGLKSIHYIKPEVTIGADKEWKFYFFKEGTLNIPSGALISELHITDGKENKLDLKLNDPVLLCEILRDFEPNSKLELWKHGLSGLYDNQGKIRPTNWYGEQHEFNFEFVVNLDAQILKIFNNLKIISNKTEPYKFEYEIVGEGYEWFEYKKIIHWINLKVKEGTFTNLQFGYYTVLSTPYERLLSKYPDFPDLFYDRDTSNGWCIPKLPYLEITLTDKKGLPEKTKSYTNKDSWTGLTPTDKYKYNTSETIIVEDAQLNEYRVHTEQYGNNMKKYGRVRGNMEYLEDLWDIEIRPIHIKWAYLTTKGLAFKDTETRHRDKYIKIKVRYTGEDLVVILAVNTMFDYSFA